MANYNRVILAGNLTKDPEIRYLPSGQSVTNMTIAVNSRFKQNGEIKEEVSFFDLAAFGKTAEVCAEHLVKGRPVLIEGRLKQRRWEDDRGNKRSKVDVLVDHVQFLGAPRNDNTAGRGISGAAGDIPDEDIPF